MKAKKLLAFHFGEDRSARAIAIRCGIARRSLTRAAEEILTSVDLVTSTGCIGYVGEKTFERLLPAITQGQAPWIGNFALRMFSFDAIQGMDNRSLYLACWRLRRQFP